MTNEEAVQAAQQLVQQAMQKTTDNNLQIQMANFAAVMQNVLSSLILELSKTQDDLNASISNGVEKSYERDEK